MSGHVTIAGSCRKILLGVPRLGGTKVEIVGVDMVLPSLRRSQERSQCVGSGRLKLVWS